MLSASAHERRGHRALAAFDYEGAVAAFQNALNLMRRDQPRAVRLQSSLADALLLSGRAEEAFDNALTALGRAQELGESLIPFALHQLARYAWIMARYPDVRNFFDSYLGRPVESVTVDYLNVIIDYSHILATLGQPDLALTMLRQADRCKASATLDVFVRLLQEKAYVMSLMAMERDALSTFELAAAMVRNREEPELTVVTLNNFAVSARHAGQTMQALSLHSEALALLDKVKIEWRIQYCLVSQGITCYYAGDLKGSVALLTRSLANPPNNPQVRLLQAPLGLLLRLAIGDPSIAERGLDQALIDVAFRSEDPPRIANVSAAMHKAYTLRGQARLASELLKRACRNIRNPDGCSLLYLQVAQHGDRQTVQRVLEDITRLHVESLVRRGLDALLHSRLLALDGERLSLQEADRAASIFELLNWPMHRAVALELAERYGEAAKLYETCGARAEVKRLRGRRWRAGRPRRIVGQLTKREAEVAKLCARGLRNREIAERTGVTIATVEFHMRNILRELNLTSRHEVRDALAEL